MECPTSQEAVECAEQFIPLATELLAPCQGRCGATYEIAQPAVDLAEFEVKDEEPVCVEA